MRTGPLRPLAAGPRKGTAGAPSTVRAVRGSAASGLHNTVRHLHDTRHCHEQHCLFPPGPIPILGNLKLTAEAADMIDSPPLGG